MKYSVQDRKHPTDVRSVKHLQQTPPLTDSLIQETDWRFLELTLLGRCRHIFFLVGDTKMVRFRWSQETAQQLSPVLCFCDCKNLVSSCIRGKKKACFFTETEIQASVIVLFENIKDKNISFLSFNIFKCAILWACQVNVAHIQSNKTICKTRRKHLFRF